MTQAVCIGCGAGKIGAFVPCFECRFDPARPFDATAMAKSLILSDHHQDAAGLENASAVLRSGRALTWPDADVAQLAAKIDAEYPGERSATAAAAAPKPARSMGRLLVILIVAAVMIAGAARWILR